jgi:hypothetical protein
VYTRCTSSEGNLSKGRVRFRVQRIPGPHGSHRPNAPTGPARCLNGPKFQSAGDTSTGGRTADVHSGYISKMRASTRCRSPRKPVITGKCEHEVAIGSLHRRDLEDHRGQHSRESETGGPTGGAGDEPAQAIDASRAAACPRPVLHQRSAAAALVEALAQDRDWHERKRLSESRRRLCSRTFVRSRRPKP